MAVRGFASVVSGAIAGVSAAEAGLDRKKRNMRRRVDRSKECVGPGEAGEPSGPCPGA